MPYKIEIVKSAEKESQKIDKKYLRRIVASINTLSDNPFPLNTKKLVGSDSSYRLRAGQYRILYEVDTNNKIVTIFRIRHRKDAYK
ncbi:MAG: type II toxin-antitoxin system RelE/ParE family toxin [Candidatus Marinimicrobia bacterium]|nr:type II toxin-antitoxin system RelE/ParE family toxin [Candidatus Neomarinimicrobiota bacterium]